MHTVRQKYLMDNNWWHFVRFRLQVPVNRADCRPETSNATMTQIIVLKRLKSPSSHWPGLGHSTYKCWHQCKGQREKVEVTVFINFEDQLVNLVDICTIEWRCSKWPLFVHLRKQWVIVCSHVVQGEVN